MKKTFAEKLPRIIKNKKKLEENLNIKISNRGREVFISGCPEEEHIAEKVIDALNFGFPFKDALSIKENENSFEVINIKDYAKSKNLPRVRSRIIGKRGKTLKTLRTLTSCFFEIKDNEVGIIGAPENIQKAERAIISLIQGSKQANVYSFLEKNQSRPIFDLGLKE